MFEDNDILLVELADNISILVKSRYDTDFESSSIYVEAPFFYSVVGSSDRYLASHSHLCHTFNYPTLLIFQKNYVPVKLNLNRRIVKVVTFNCPLFGSINGAGKFSYHKFIKPSQNDSS